MTKRITAIILTIMLIAITSYCHPIKAHALGITTSTAGVFEAYMLLLGLGGLKAESSSIFDESLDLTYLENQIKEYSLDLYYWFIDTSNKIAAHNKIVGIDAEKLQQLREWEQSKGWNTVDTRQKVGTCQFNINDLSISGAGYYLYYLVETGQNRYYLQNNGMSYIPVMWEQGGDTWYGFVPTYDTINDLEGNTPTNIGELLNYNSQTVGDRQPFNFGGAQTAITFRAYTRILNKVVSTNISWLVIDEFVPAGNTNKTITFQNFLNAFYAGTVTDQQRDVYMEAVEGVNGVATSVDETVVGAGTKVGEDNGDTVITDDATINLTNIDIQALLKQLADNQITYEQFVNALQLTAVNTQTMTKEEIEAIVDSRTIAQAGVQQITGPFTVDLTSLFPFCIPFDLYNLIKAFEAEPQAPEVTIKIPVGYNGQEFTWEEYIVSLSQFDTVAQTVRIFEYIAFIVGLMLITRKLIEG